ncbi:Glycosyl transferase, family 1 [Moorella glycerini]|uniref:2-deoxystreptamine glucosyltransferase n=1 Tax=Neomoorella stamsii TaxID=1266720 RepID=A0A9X7P7K1_9FIRM|nr:MULTISPECIES: glycosyltransferase family 4 protein [Moorella]PRR77046.1 2-deoxystreptamine glucosyltransferase [Moorella stamsii]CEP68821.1 Glycosyl transferase, family 1 [Moorella glycerini]
MMINRLVYLANVRLPTEKAHGYQICKMCEAFAANGVEVTLMHPRRRQLDPELSRQTIFSYYGIAPSFGVRSLPNLDVVLWERFFPKSIFAPVFFAHTLAWGLYAALVARGEGADVYYTRDSGVAYWLTRIGLPTVYEAHVVPKRGQRWLLQRIARRPALRLVVCLTSFIKKGFAEMGFPEEKIVVLPDGVDLSLFKNLPGKEECRRRLGLPLERPVIGYIGRFRTMEMEKGIPELVQAVAKLPTINGQEPLLVCVGGPMDVVPGYLELADRVDAPRERFMFVDRVPNTEVPFWIRSCDVVTIPWPWNEFSAYFTSPLKLFEYMAAGVPIVATDLPSIREILRHRENAWLVEPNDECLAQAIFRITTDRSLAQELIEGASRDINNYTWERRAYNIIIALKIL